MDIHDDLSKLNPQEGTTADSNPQQPTGEECQNPSDAVATPAGHAPQAGSSQDLDVAGQQERIKGEPQDHIERLTTEIEEPGKQPELVRQDASDLPDLHNNSVGQDPQPSEGNLQTQVKVSAGDNASSVHTEANLPATKSIVPEPEATEVEPVRTDPSKTVPTSATAESHRGNPYKLSGSLVVVDHEHEESKPGAGTPQVGEVQEKKPTKHSTQDAATDAHEDTEFGQDYEDGSSHDGDASDTESHVGDTQHCRTSKQRPQSKENERETSEDEPSYDEHDCGDVEEGDDDWDDEDMRKLAIQVRRDVNAHSSLARRQGHVQGGMGYQMSHSVPDNVQLNGQHHFPGFANANYGQPQPSQAFDARAFAGMQDPRIFQQHGMQYPGFQQIGQQLHQGANNMLQGSMPMPPNFQADAQNFSQHTLTYQDPRYAMLHQGPYPPAPAYDKFQRTSYAMQPRMSAFALSNPRAPTSAPVAPGPEARQQGSRRTTAVKESDSSKEDEPLRKRIALHHSTTGDSVTGSSPSSRLATVKNEQKGQDIESEVESVASEPKLGFKSAKEKKTVPKQGPAPSSKAIEGATRESPSETGNIDWTLPQYEALFEPGATKNDPTIARVSIPGIVREEIFLSPDHAEQETHLFLHIFLPNQQRLETPDTHPALAILNFHTVAVMVIEAFVQYEIGDEFGMGRGHWHNDHDQDGDVEYQRLREAKEADPDEIFFAVIDRWRAGIESNKQAFKLIRGSQEFCDIALDIIFFIREHGLLKERQRMARSDKVVKRGAKKVEEQELSEEEDTPMKGTKRGAGKVNEPKVTKKPKVQPKPKTPTKPRKSRARVPAVTVIRKAK